MTGRAGDDYVEHGGSWWSTWLIGPAVGRERVAFSDIDVDHLPTVDSGVDAGAPILGGGWSLPRGRTGLPLGLTDGRTVLAPTRDPAALRAALLAALSLARGTLDA